MKTWDNETLSMAVLGLRFLPSYIMSMESPQNRIWTLIEGTQGTYHISERWRLGKEILCNTHSLFPKETLMPLVQGVES